MTTTPSYELYNSERDQAAVIRMLVLAFAGSTEHVTQWLAAAERDGGRDQLRVVRDGGKTVATLTRIPMGQYFGGVSVPMVGIAGVAVPPEERGRGYARFLMQEAMREMARDGMPLTSLYASTQALYRQVGYEQAGHAFTIRIPLVQIDVRERGGRARVVEQLGEADQPAIEACAGRFATGYNGQLDRGKYIWSRIRESRGEKFHPFGVRNADGTIDGYMFLTQVRKSDQMRHDISLSDVAFTTPAAGRRLLGFLKDFASMADDVTFKGGPWHPLLALLGQQRYEIKWKDTWMLRITDVKRALESRGYAPGMNGEARVDVDDETCREAGGRFVVRVRDGKGMVERAGNDARPAAKVNARSLAAMYAGFWTARDAALVGEAGGDSAELEKLGAMFGGGQGWLGDHF